MPRITKISQMWTFLDVFTYDAGGKERPVNHLNEWGGYSRVLGMPVFTGWRDRTTFDRDSKTTSAVVSDSSWAPKVGRSNQERWVEYTLAHSGQAAFFIVHAVDEEAQPRKIAAIDSERVFIGTLRRDGTKSILTGKPKLIAA